MDFNNTIPYEIAIITVKIKVYILKLKMFINRNLEEIMQV